MRGWIEDVVVFVQVDDRALKLVPRAQILTNSKVRHRFSPTAILPSLLWVNYIKAPIDKFGLSRLS